ncbi:hypothetical protein [Actinoplanes sp. NPDC051494]|uniref:hypothetical protein n=1 Tax=Actinoplanes sp. NPDC051494 TaxID=3363907 RepID=UPI0037BC884C
MIQSLGVLVLVVALGGCSDQAEEAEPRQPAAAVTVASASAVLDDPPGTLACGKAVAAVREGTVTTPGVADAILRASETADAPVADAAQRLAQAYATAVAAAGADDEPDKVAAVSAAAAEMVSVCRDSGLETAG